MMFLKSIHDFRILLGRNFRVLFADLPGLSLTICLAPVISALVICTFWQISRDTANNDNLLLSSQVFCDTIHIMQWKNVMEEDQAAPDLPSYSAENAQQAFADFCADYYLYRLERDNSLRTGKSPKEYSSQAKKYWGNDERDAVTLNDFALRFSLFRYNLAGKKPFMWPKWIINNAHPQESPDWWWPQNSSGEFLTPQELLESRYQAMKDYRQSLSGEESARLWLTVFFILVSAAIWMGLLPACREIVSEWEVFVREKRILYPCLPYVMAKFTMLGISACFQDLIMVLMIGLWWQKFPVGHLFGLYIVLLLASLTAIALSLLVSSCAPTLRAALTIAPIIMITQVIQGGLLRLPSQDRDIDSGWRECRDIIQKVTQQYWAFEAASGIISRLPVDHECIEQNDGLLFPKVTVLQKPPEKVVTSASSLETFLDCETLKLDDYVFGAGTSRLVNLRKAFQPVWETAVEKKLVDRGEAGGILYHICRPCLWLVAQCLMLLFLTCLCLRLRTFFARQGGKVTAWLCHAPRNNTFQPQ